MREPSQLARKIERLMKKRGLYAAQLARKAGVEKVYLSDLFKGKSSNPRCEKIVKIADALDCSIDYLFSRTRTQELRSTPSLPQNMVRIPICDMAEIGQSDAASSECASIDHYWQVPIAELFSFTTRPQALVVVIVRGEMMQPDYVAGERILVDRSQQDVSVDGVYIILDEARKALRQLQVLSPCHDREARIRVSCKNKDYVPETVKPHELDIYGRVVGKWCWF